MNQSEKKKKKILTVTEKLLQGQKIPEITMEEIAKKAEVSKVTIFKYFINKDNLMNTVLHSALSDLVEKMRDILSQNLNFEESYLAITRFKVAQVRTFTSIFADNIMQQYRESPDFFNIDIRAIQTELLGKIFKKGRAEHKINPNYSDKELQMLVDLFDEGLKGVDIDFAINHSETIARMFLGAIR